jgi:membrane-bound inhibitor of C-type lysozyme
MSQMGKTRTIVTAAMLASFAAGPAAAQKFVNYTCRDGSQFAAAFFRDTPMAYLQLDGKGLSLPRRFSPLRGARYAKSGITFVVNGDAATLRRAGRSTQCTTER